MRPTRGLCREPLQRRTRDDGERSCAYVSAAGGRRRKGISVGSHAFCVMSIATQSRAARALERWGNARAWSGTDPYDALNATPAARSRAPVAARAARRHPGGETLAGQPSSAPGRRGRPQRRDARARHLRLRPKRLPGRGRGAIQAAAMHRPPCRAALPERSLSRAGATTSTSRLGSSSTRARLRTRSRRRSRVSAFSTPTSLPARRRCARTGDRRRRVLHPPRAANRVRARRVLRLSARG